MVKFLLTIRIGAEKIIELKLNDEQRKKFLDSVEAIKRNLAQVPPQFLS